jgi:hypothetical protein
MIRPQDLGYSQDPFAKGTVTAEEATDFVVKTYTKIYGHEPSLEQLETFVNGALIPVLAMIKQQITGDFPNGNDLPS